MTNPIIEKFFLEMSKVGTNAIHEEELRGLLVCNAALSYQQLLIIEKGIKFLCVKKKDMLYFDLNKIEQYLGIKKERWKK